MSPAPAVDKSKNEIDRQTFTNPTWKLEIALVSADNKPALEYRLTNISKRRQDLRIDFVVGFRGLKTTENLFVDGEPLGPYASVAKTQPLAVLGSPEGLESILQKFDWRTAPVKRVDRLELGYHSPRTAGMGLFAYDFPYLKGDITQGPMTAGDYTDEGLRRRRYSEITQQVRRMPVAMVLIVDQHNIQDVLAAFANSKLRLLTTQWEWHRYYGDIKPNLPQSPTAAPTTVAARPPVARAGAEDEDAGEGPSRRRGRRTASGPGPVAVVPLPTINRRWDVQEWELVDLAVYGIATLYERFPPNPKAPAVEVKGAATKKVKRPSED
jgi:hypothetical protein